MTKTAAVEQSWTRLRASLGFKSKPSWPEPELSVGIWYRKMGMSDCWEAKGPAREKYGPLSKDIKRILDERIEFLNEREPVSKTVTFSLYMTGRTKTNAKPTIIFCCERPLPRRRARNLIKENGILDSYPGWILGDSSFPPEFDEPLIRLALGNTETGIGIVARDDAGAVLYRPSDRAYGIEIFIKGYGSQVGVRRATVGGIIRAEDRYYGLTVAHAFSEVEVSTGPLDKVDFEFDLDDSDEEIDLDEQDLVEETSRGSQSPGSEAGKNTSSIMSYRSEVDFVPERSHIQRGAPTASTPSLVGMAETNIDSDDISETQQAAMGPLVEFGDLMVSATASGSDSLDWALIEIRETQIQAFKNLDKRGPGRRFLSPEQAAEPAPKDAAIIALTASGEMLNGSLFGTPAYLHVPQTKKFQEVWTIALNGQLTNGDCGTWVIDARTGILYGHIISGTLGSGAAYIMPACHIFNDVRQQLPSFEVYMGVELSLQPKSQMDMKSFNIKLLEKSRSEVAKLNQDMSKRDDESKKERSELRATIRMLEKLRDKMRIEQDQNLLELEKKRLEITQLLDQNERLTSQLKPTKALYKNLIGDHDILRRNYESLRKDHESLSRDYGSLRKDHESSGRDRESLRKDHESLSRDHESLRKDHESLRKDYESLKRDRDGLRSNYVENKPPPKVDTRAQQLPIQQKFPRPFALNVPGAFSGDETLRSKADEMEDMPVVYAHPRYRSTEFGNLSTPNELPVIRSEPPFIARVGNLPFRTNLQDIRIFFKDCDSKNIRIVEQDMKSGVFADAEFRSYAGLKKALDLNGRLFRGKIIRINVDPGSGYNFDETRDSSELSRKTTPPVSKLGDNTWPKLKRVQDATKGLNTSILPQPTLPYLVATLHIGRTTLQLDCKPRGRNIPNGRELVTFDVNGKVVLKHRIKFPDKRKACYPYIGREALECQVTFPGVPREDHELFFKGEPLAIVMPRYAFTLTDDFIDFQGEVRGKKLVAQFFCIRILSGSGTMARDEYLKIWKDEQNDQCSISFYARSVDEQGDIEFPVAMFVQQDNPDIQGVRLEFKIARATGSLTGSSSLRLRETSAKGQLNTLYEVSTPEDLGLRMKYLRIIFPSTVGVKEFQSLWKTLYDKEMDQVRDT